MPVKSLNQNPRRSILRSAALFLSAAPMLWNTAGVAQSTVERRVDRLEQELRAVQRTVFPGGAGRIVAPDVAPATSVPQAPAGTPATLPIADLTARVSAIEAQLAQLTGQVEVNGNRLMKLEQANANIAASPVRMSGSDIPGGALPATAQSVSAAPGSQSQPAPGAAAPSLLARNEQVAAVERPSTGNAALDSYTYGYRLWAAKFYPEAQAQLLTTLEKYGNDPVASRTQNLLGRAYLDDGKPVTAAKTLYENYRLRPKGERAAESLAWTAEALLNANDAPRACAAYEELNDVFGGAMPSNVRDMMAKGRARAKCGA